MCTFMSVGASLGGDCVLRFVAFEVVGLGALGICSELGQLASNLGNID